MQMTCILSRALSSGKQSCTGACDSTPPHLSQAGSRLEFEAVLGGQWDAKAIGHQVWPMQKSLDHDPCTVPPDAYTLQNNDMLTSLLSTYRHIEA